MRRAFHVEVVDTAMPKRWRIDAGQENLCRRRQWNVLDLWNDMAMFFHRPEQGISSDHYEVFLTTLPVIEDKSSSGQGPSKTIKPA